MGTKCHMAQSSHGVRQEPSGENCGVASMAWLPPSLLSDQWKLNVESPAWGSGPLWLPELNACVPWLGMLSMGGPWRSWEGPPG